jgi:hypothetical protein
MLLVRQAGTLHRRLPEKVENKDGYKHKSRTDGKYRSRRDHKSKHKNKHKVSCSDGSRAGLRPGQSGWVGWVGPPGSAQ